MIINSIGIAGHGHFGKFLEELVARLAPEVSVRIYSRRSAPDGARFFSIEEVAACDVVILCGGIAEYETQLRELLPHLGERTIVVDVATVKMHTEELFASVLGSRPYLCVHPMFGPESYEKRGGDISGFRIVVTADTLPDGTYEALRDMLTSLGFLVVRMTGEEHDELLANTLFLTHYISQSILQGGFARTPIDTPSFQSLMDAVEAVQNDRKLFEDVYRFNQFCKESAARFHTSQETVWQSLQK